MRSIVTTLGILASLAFPAWASEPPVQKPITVAHIQGTITVAPDEKGTFTVQPQGTKVPADVRKIATNAKTVITIAQEKIKVSDLKAGMWVRAEMADVARRSSPVICGLKTAKSWCFSRACPRNSSRIQPGSM